MNTKKIATLDIALKGIEAARIENLNRLDRMHIGSKSSDGYQRAVRNVNASAEHDSEYWTKFFRYCDYKLSIKTFYFAKETLKVKTALQLRKALHGEKVIPGEYDGIGKAAVSELCEAVGIDPSSYLESLNDEGLMSKRYINKRRSSRKAKALENYDAIYVESKLNFIPKVEALRICNTFAKKHGLTLTDE